MDPNAAVRRWRKAIQSGDHDEAREALQDLKDWIRRGGAHPTINLMPHEKIAMGIKTKKRNACANPCNPCNPCANPKPKRRRKKAKNPNFHYPHTNRGRPPVDKGWSLGFYGAGDVFLGKTRISTSRADAHAAAKGYVGTKRRGKIVHKVILTGPK